MKQLLNRVWNTLLLILNMIWRYVLQPLFAYTQRKGKELYKQHQHRLSRFYWKDKLQQARTYNWRNPKPDDVKLFWRGIRKVALSLVLAFFLLYLLVYIGLFGGMPSKADLREKQNNTASEVYSADSVLLGRYYLQDRTNVKFEDISEDAVKALIATEDARFYNHYGIDPRSLLRVFFKTLLLQDESSGGGSTISQQLAKNLYPRKDYWLLSTPINKLRESIIAVRLEQVYNKQEILELYLNTVPLGGNLFGIERSARRFFNTSADSLSTQEAAVLIGMLKATTTYNPRLNPEKSRERRNVVLNQMAKYEYLTEEKAAALQELPLKLNYRFETHNDGMAPYFREQLRLELAEWCSQQTKENGEPYNLYTDGLKIYTTLDAGMQKQAERAVAKQMARLQRQFNIHWKGRNPWGKNNSVIQTAMQRSDRYRKLKAAGLSDSEIRENFEQPTSMNVFSWQGTQKQQMTPLDSVRHYARLLNTGLLAIEPRTGYIRSWVGGIHHQVFKYDHVRAKRQVGSTFKPIVYAAALEQGMQPCSYFPNQRITYPDYENWSPRNANDQYGGKFSMAGALAGSVNTVSAQVLMQTGIEPTVSLARQMGVQGELPEVPSLALGVASLSLYEMVAAYTTFANDGYYVEPVYVLRVVDREGKTLRQHEPGEGISRALSYESAATMIRMMQGVVEDGSGRRLRSEFGLSMDIAGKTGTTQDHADGWFIGITPDLVTGVWVGAEDPAVRFRTLALGQGANTALPIWGAFMASLTRTESFDNMRYSRFAPVPPEIEGQLACLPYQDETPVYVEEKEKDNFLDRLFDQLRGKGKNKNKKEYKERDGKESWKKDEERRREREKKREERARESEKKRREEEKKWEEKAREREKKREEKQRERDKKDNR